MAYCLRCKSNYRRRASSNTTRRDRPSNRNAINDHRGFCRQSFRRQIENLEQLRKIALQPTDVYLTSAHRSRTASLSRSLFARHSETHAHRDAQRRGSPAFRRSIRACSSLARPAPVPSRPGSHFTQQWSSCISLHCWENAQPIDPPPKKRGCVGGTDHLRPTSDYAVHAHSTHPQKLPLPSSPRRIAHRHLYIPPLSPLAAGPVCLISNSGKPIQTYPWQ